MKKYIITTTATTLLLAGCGDSRQFDATGTFESANEITVSAEATGKIEWLDLQEGDSLSAGKEIGVIDTMQLYLSKLQLKKNMKSIRYNRPDIGKQIAATKEQIRKQEYEKQRIITCHIGNGGSITAIRDGKSVDTSMGLTPVEGLMMGTRCGDIDPAALLYLQEKMHLDANGSQALINKKSGVLGISGISSDMRDIENAIKEGNKRAELALKMYEYRIVKYIGAYTAALGGVDIIVFTGGVGENQTVTRSCICKQLEYLGVVFDEESNAVRGEEVTITKPESKVKVVVIPTDEEYMIACDTAAIVNGK